MAKPGYGFIRLADNLVELVWGGHRIEHMKGLPSSGRSIGESWECSGHSQHPSTAILEDGSDIPLDRLIGEMGEEILGPDIAGDFGHRLPVLVKIIDAREDLSVQVHPGNEEADELDEPDSGKDEAWLVLDAEDGAILYLGFTEGTDPEQFEKDLLSPDINIAEKYLRPVPVKKGDIFFNPAGTAHAVGKGILLAEIQQSSSLTYRVWDWNRSPKRPLHIEQAMRVLDFDARDEGSFRRTPKPISDSEEKLIDSLYFSLNRLTLKPGQGLAMDTLGGFQVLTCIEGNMLLQNHDSTVKIPQGQSVLVSAGTGDYSISTGEGAVLLKSFVNTTRHIDPVIFQTYDVRAIADEYLPDRTIYYLAKGYGTYLRRIKQSPAGKLWVAVGGSIRLSTERIRRPVITGLRSTGINVYDLGITSTPDLYFSIPYLEADGGINITASHNEAEYNGLKQVITGDDGYITSIDAGDMLTIKDMVLKGDFIYEKEKGQYICLPENEIALYHNELVKANCRLGRDIWIALLEKRGYKNLKPLLDTAARLEFPEGLDEERWHEIQRLLGLDGEFEQPATAIKHPLENLKLVIDFGNGSAWRTEETYRSLGAKVIALNATPDGSFPAHIPDPIKARYRRQLEETMLAEGAKARSQPEQGDKELIGIGFDEDADRGIFVRSDGRVVEGDRTLAIQAKALIEEHKRLGREGRPRFMGEVKFSKATEEFITALGGEYIMSPTGFAFIKEGCKLISRAVKKGLSYVDVFGRRIDLTGNRQPVFLAAELSGHQMSGHEENWIFDDSTMAAIKLLVIIAQARARGKSFTDLDEEVPRYSATPELNIRLPTNIVTEKQEIVDKVVERFRAKGYPIDTTDGGLIKWFNERGEWRGQALVRKSNTQPMIICRVEGRDDTARIGIEQEFFGELSQVSTESVIRLDLASDDYVKELIEAIGQ
ncbi:MAG: hypothetical protein JSW16_08570 [Dehalococcoidales bacterium]|nr:MAG: hypothetical protein JSW16_08570 [Dehalococcoidales bacterium]